MRPLNMVVMHFMVSRNGVTMPEIKIDKNLVEWEELSELEWKNLLLGNGFSINIWSRFGYRTLFEVAQREDIDHQLTAQSLDRKSTRLNSSHVKISYAVFCLKK